MIRIDDIRQSTQAECGPACLAAIASAHGRHDLLAELHKQRLVSARGWTLLQMRDIARQFGLEATAYRLEMEELGELPKPAVLHWNFNHFVVLLESGTEHLIHDPAIGTCVRSAEEVSNGFTGFAMAFAPGGSFAESAKRRRAILPRIGRLDIYAWLLAAGVAIAATGFAFLSPLLIRSLSGGLSAPGIAIILALFACVAAIRAATGAALDELQNVRSYHFVRARSRALVEKALTLPFALSEQQDSHELTGQIERRIGAIEAVFRRRSDMTIAAVTWLLAMIMLLLIEPRLCVVWLTGNFAIVALGIFIKRTNEKQAGGVAVERAWARTILRENLSRRRGVERLGLGDLRLNLWVQRETSAARRGSRQRRATERLRSLSEFLSNLAFIAFQLCNIFFFIAGHYGLGSLLAAVFIAAIGSDAVRRALSAHEDLARYEGDGKALEALLALGGPATDDPLGRHPEKDIALRAGGLCYAHDRLAKPIIADLSLAVRSGERVAITGASGSGKSTLMKLLCGLYHPDQGWVSMAQGHSLGDVAAIFQEPDLFAGSIRENVSGFADLADEDRIWAALRVAGFDEEIRSSSMGLETIIAATGAPFSAGERNRLAIARAIYQQPKLMIIDEATAHLDAHAESAIMERLIKVCPTIIYVGHRSGVLSYMDRVLRLEQGRLHEMSQAA